MRDFAAREEKLSADLRARSAVETRAFDIAREKQSTEAAETMAKAEANFQSAQEARNLRFERRKTRLNEAHHKARKRILDEINKYEADIKYNVQTGSLEAERLRDENLLKSANALEDFNRRATESYNRFALLEASAKKAFGGYGGFKKLLASDREWPQPDLSADENQLLEQLQQLEKKLENDLHRFRTRFPAFVFRFLPIWLWAVLLLGFAVAVPAFQHFGIKGLPMSYAGISAGAFVVVFIGYLIGGKQNSAPAREIAGNLAKSRWWLNACFEKAKTRAQQEQLRFRNETADAIHGMNQQWKHSVKEAIEMRGVRPIKIGEKAQRAFQKNEHIHEVRLQRLNNDFAMTRAHLSRRSGTRGEGPRRGAPVENGAAAE